MTWFKGGKQLLGGSLFICGNVSLSSVKQDCNCLQGLTMQQHQFPFCSLGK